MAEAASAASADDLHPASAPAEGGLDRDGPAVGLAESDDLCRVRDGLARPGTPATPARAAASRALILSPMISIAAGRRPDEGRARVGDRPGEGGVLGEEAVARVDGVGAAARQITSKIELGCEVALGRRLAAQRVGLVGQPDMEGVLVELGVDGDRRDAELAAGPDDPHGDLAPVRDEHLVEHGPPSST